MYYGCKPTDKVLEIGCGALNAGFPIMQYLERGNYYGIEPNFWATEASLQLPEVREFVTAKDPHFDANENFDGTMFGVQFDYVISHSILSHAAHWQWPLFMKNVDRCLKKGGKVFASLHFTEGNGYGDTGYPGTELDFNEWVYPGVSYFRKETIQQVAREYGYTLTMNDFVPAFMITNVHPIAHHSWIILEKR